ncbi:TIGR03986 family CRISPR-associated RAMP protein [Pseudoalteromonas sp. SS15]|uniref:TIGR03986 family type III CRISPR-associated RAMP protein n=1 Tax=Pseudoalteromonas sp. SS15 TaxID=3139393 RepID=UPI003BA9FBB5
MTNVHTPYHFVPLSKWVYMPDWAHLVSHDLPLQDGLSGSLEYTLKNHTPLCVGSEKDHQDILRVAKNPDGTPIIPATSLKGMIRNVLEIASFGKFNSIDKQRFSYRDVSSKSEYLSQVIQQSKVVSGWIKYNQQDQVWQFKKCQFAKVAHSDINNALTLNKAIENVQTAVAKYQTLPLHQSCNADISEPKGKQKNQWAENLTLGQTPGHFVFTNNRIKGKGKPQDYEFSYFFYNTESVVYADNIKNQVDDFFTSHNEEQITYLKYNQHPEFGIPVFALLDKQDKKQIHSFGLAKMPRVRYQFDTHDLINHIQPAHFDDAYFDMAELMFGTLRDNELGLKSRVIFSDAIAQQHSDWHTQLYQAKPTVLSSPKASFLGAYIEQSSDDNGYKAYNHSDAKPSGWKRYPARRDYTHHAPSNDNDTVTSKFELLKENNTFKGKVVFHNLKHEELAALIWCLTLGNRSENFHTLGHAKPLGAGSVQLTLNQETSSVLSNETREQLDKSTQAWCELFEQHMNMRFEPQDQWKTSSQIQHLLALSDEYIENYNTFKYLELADYKAIKNEKAAIAQLEDSGKKLSREERYNANTASSAFAKGRLAKLFNPDSEFHSMQQNAQEDYQVRKQKQHLKAQAKKEKQVLEQAPPFESCVGRLEIIVKMQDNLSKTEKVKNAKDLREILKTIKANDLTAEQCKHLIGLYLQITIASKETKSALNYLEKQL